MPDPAAPFALGEGPDCCLLLHGLTGSPHEVRPIAEQLAAVGVRAVGLLLPGHGSRPEDLARVDRHDLLRAVRSAVAEQANARRLFLCGVSMGALLALRLAAEPGSRIHALALIAPAVSFVGLSRVFTDVVGLLPGLPYLVSKGGRDIQARAGQPPRALADERDADGAYDRVPLRWGRELRLLCREALADAPRVRAPALLLHGGLDRTTSPSGARKLAGLLGSDDIALRIYPRSGHVLPLDLDGAAASRAVARFFLRSEE